MDTSKQHRTTYPVEGCCACCAPPVALCRTGVRRCALLGFERAASSHFGVGLVLGKVGFNIRAERNARLAMADSVSVSWWPLGGAEELR